MDWPIGRTWDGGSFTARAADARAYAAATEDGNPVYAGAITPPMFHTRAVIDLMMTLARAPELGIDMLRLVHGEHGMRFLRPVHAGDVVAIEGELLAVTPKPTGTIYAFALRGRVAGEPVWDGQTAYFIRGETPPPKGGPKAPAAEPPPPSWSVSQPVALDQATRYAAASGDHNPIHVDAEVAKKAGLPGVILHGLCTLAFAARDLVDRSCGGDPARLAAIQVRFAAPVFPGDTLRMDVWEEPGALAFATFDGRGRPVLTHGRAEVR